MKCIHCGQELPDGQHICPNCGQDNNLEKLLNNADIPEELDHLSTHQIIQKIKRLHLIKRKHLGFIFIAVLAVGVIIFSSRWLPAKKLYQSIHNFHDDLVEISGTNALGNSNANLAGGGTLVVYGNQMYVSSEGKIYNVSLALDNKRAAIDHSGRCMNIVQDTLYYINTDKDNIVTVVDIPTRTSVATKIKADYLMAVGDYVYYLESGTHHSIYQMKADFSSKKALTQSGCQMFNIVDDWLYYTTADGFYRVPILGGEVAKIADGQFGNFAISNRLVYYKTSSNKIWRMNLDGSEQVEITDQAVSDFVVSDRYLYFTGISAGVFKQSLETGEVKQLSTDEAETLQLAGTWIYYQLRNSDEGRFVSVDENSETITPVYAIKE